jgi:hypothetical protein
MLLALIVFIMLLACGIFMQELRWMHVGMCLLLVVLAAALFATFHWQPIFYNAVLAGMDIVLILVIFKGDISIR